MTLYRIASTRDWERQERRQRLHRSSSTKTPPVRHSNGRLRNTATQSTRRNQLFFLERALIFWKATRDKQWHHRRQPPPVATLQFTLLHYDRFRPQARKCYKNRRCVSQKGEILSTCQYSSSSNILLLGVLYFSLARCFFFF